MAVTLTQVLAERNQVRLYGRKVTDFALRGDLGLGGHDPEGPIVFASIDAFAVAGEPPTSLQPPLLLSVHGEGQPASDAEPAWSPRRCWTTDRDAVAWLATLKKGPLLSLIGPAPRGGEGGGPQASAPRR
jgi:hypothetical protein